MRERHRRSPDSPPRCSCWRPTRRARWVLHGLSCPSAAVVILPVLNLTMVWNRGITFGLLTGSGALGPIWPLAVVALVVVVVARGLASPRRSGSRRRALGAITGGALGNVADRLRLGLPWWISSMPTPSAGRGMYSTWPTRRSFAAWPRWSSTTCYPDGRTRPRPGRKIVAEGRMPRMMTMRWSLLLAPLMLAGCSSGTMQTLGLQRNPPR